MCDGCGNHFDDRSLSGRVALGEFLKFDWWGLQRPIGGFRAPFNVR